MKFKINVKEFVNGLEPAFNVATKNVNSEFETAFHVILHAKSDHILTVAHGGFAAIISPISKDNGLPELAYECIEEGKVIVNAIKLMGTLRSFLFEQNVIVDDESGQLKIDKEIIKKEKDDDDDDDDEKDQFQTIPIVKIEERVIPVAKEYNKSIKVNREIFVESMKKVEFAIGYEESKPYFECIMFEANKDKLRFASGTGSRFAVRDIEGSFDDIKEKTQFFFPKNNISNIINILEKASSENIIIKESINKEDTPDQIVIRFNETTLLLLGLDTSIKYYDMDKVIKNNYPNRIVTELADWNCIMSGIGVTFDEDMRKENEIHNTNVTISKKAKNLLIETKTVMQARRRINIVEVERREEAQSPYFRCNTVYLGEMASKEDKKGKITVNFKNQSDTDDDKIPPVLVEYPERDNEAKNVKEKFYIFFSISRRP